jgi:diadenosine tetraphosphatase ApaH/serine/threonine PP2A family protein phosphatase
MNRTFVIGDVHGCFDELMTLLDKIQYNEGVDRLIFAGDLVDRGPASGKVVRWVREAHVRTNGMTTSVLGNHDDAHFRYFKHTVKKRDNPNYRIPMKPFTTDKLLAHNAMTDEDLEFLGTLPMFVHLETQDWVVVHAGLEPGKALEDQDSGKLTHIRFLNPVNRKTVSLDKNLIPPDGSIYWTEAYDMPHNVVYGHNVHDTNSPRVVMASSGAQLVGLDTGCVFGGTLTAFRVPDTREEQVTPEHFVSVSASRSYSRSVLNQRGGMG